MPPNANLTWDPEVRNELKVVFQITNDKQADELAQTFARAGAMEALDLATGRITVTSMANARSHRIMCLLKSGIPVPRCKEVVSSLFGVIPAVAQRYVDTALARHRSETDLSKVTPTEFRRIQRSLNDRPRRTLGYMTPSEKLSEVVALTG
jgi:hypothetical protein